MPSLVLQPSGHADRDVALTAHPTTLGRHADCGIVIDDQSVSRQHAEIVPLGDLHGIRDLNSRNGTWLRGERVSSSPSPLQHGDDIRLGRQSVTLLYLTAEATVPEGMSPFQKFGTYAGGSVSAAASESGRAFKILRMTPWVRFASAALGVVAGLMALIWWITKWA